MAGMIATGSLCTIFGKIMDQKVSFFREEDVGIAGLHIMKESEFNHPLLMNLLMFIGEASLLIVLQFQLARDPTLRHQHNMNKMNPFVFSCPALLDTIASFLQSTGLALISASTYQILKTLCMVFTVFLSLVVFRRKYTIG